MLKHLPTECLPRIEVAHDHKINRVSPGEPVRARDGASKPNLLWYGGHHRHRPFYQVKRNMLAWMVAKGSKWRIQMEVRLRRPW